MPWAWLTSLTLNTWAQVGSNTANNVDPNDDPAINPNHPSAAPWRNGYDLTDVAAQWNGGALDDVNGVFWTGGGGHSGYYGNELYSISLESDSPAWIRRGYPSGSIQKPCASFTSDGANQSVLPDGRPHAVHNYNLFTAIGNGDVALAPGGYKYDGNATWYGFKFDHTTNDWVTGTLLDSNTGTYSCACYDPIRDKLWVFDHQYLTSVNLSTGVCTTHFNTATDAIGEYSKMVYDSTRDIFVVFLNTQASSAYGSAYVLYFDPDNPTDFIKAPQDNTALRGRTGIAYDPDGDRYLCWNGGANITVITPPATGWDTNTWVSSTLTLSGTPSSVEANGTYGRFQYSAKYGCAFLLNTLGEKLWAVKLFEAGPPPQVLAPVSDVSDGAWTPSTGTDLFACVDESTYSDTDYIAATTATTCELALADGTDPESSTGHTLNYRLLAGNGTVAVALKQGGTTIASFGPHTLTAAAQAIQQVLSGGEADAITDYTALSVALTSAANRNITYVAKSTFASGTSGLTVAAVSGVQADDLILLFVESANQAITTPSGYSVVSGAQVSAGTAATAGGMRLDVFYKWATGADASVSVADSGDHTTAIKLVYRGVDTTTPFDVTVVTGSKTTASTSSSYPAITTATDNALVIFASALDLDAASTTTTSSGSNGNITSLTERHDQTVTAGAGGGIVLYDGFKATAGSTGAMTATVTSTKQLYITLALRPAALDAKVSWISFQTPAAASGNLAASAAGAAQASGSAVLSGQVALAAAGVAVAGGSATAGAAIPLSAAGIATAGGSGNRSAAITISSAGLAQAAGQAGLAVAVQIAAAGAAAATGNATLAGQIALSASGAALAAGNATLAAQLAAIASGTAQAGGTATLSGGPAGGVSASGGATASGSATLVAQLAGIASGLATAGGSATLKAQLAAVASGGAVAGGSAALVTLFSAFAAGAAQAGGTANLSGGTAGALSASGAAHAVGSAALTATVSVNASGAAIAGGSANFTASVVLTAAGYVQAIGAGQLVVDVALSGTGQGSAGGHATLTDLQAWVALLPGGYQPLRPVIGSRQAMVGGMRPSNISSARRLA